jgi:hypothetical protein
MAICIEKCRILNELKPPQDRHWATHLEALTRRTEHVLRRHTHILKRDASCVGASLAHIVFFFSNNDTLGVGIDHECGECAAGALLRVAGPSKNKVPISDATCIIEVGSLMKMRTTTQAAIDINTPLVIHIFEPLMIHSSPFFSARVLIPATSLPAPGSVTQYAALRGSWVKRPRYSFCT